MLSADLILLRYTKTLYNFVTHCDTLLYKVSVVFKDLAEAKSNVDFSCKDTCNLNRNVLDGLEICDPITTRKPLPYNIQALSYVSTYLKTNRRTFL